MNKPIIYAAGGLVTNGNNELLMIFRRGKWDLPKGKLDPGESPEACALREVSEETGVSNLQLNKLVGTTQHEYFDTWVNAEVTKIIYWYAMQVNGHPLLIPQIEEDIDVAEWANPQKVQANLENSYPSIIDILYRNR
jgi:8-oxo-dGTP pyrophosphatase MutT (NUDIX family)